MIFTVEIKVMPLNDLLDPQGKAVLGGLQNLGLQNIADVRVGKHIVLKIDAADKSIALEQAEQAAKKLLANQVMEMYEITIA